LNSSGQVSSHVDKYDIATVRTAALTSQDRDKDQDFEEEVVLNLDDESEVDEEKIDTMLATDKSLYNLLFGTVPRYLLIVVATSAIAWQVLSTWNELWARIWLAIGPMNKLLVVPLLIGVFVHVFNSAFMVWVWQIVTMPKIANRMHKLFLDAVMTATLPFLSGSRSGALLNRFSQDMTLFAFKLPHCVFRVFISLTIVIIQCVYLISGSYYMVAFIPFLFGILWLLQSFYLQTSRQIRILDMETKTPLFAAISETAAGVEHIRAYGWQAPLLSQTYKMLDHSQKSFYYMYAVQRWLMVVLNLIATAIVCGLVSIALLVFNASSQGGLGLALMAVIYLQADLNYLITEWTTLETSLGAVARLQSFIKDTPTEKDKDGVTEQPVTWPSRGKIEFKNVSASYSSEPDARQAINDVSFQIESGESVAVVGRTGSGKSSIILTLLNFLPHIGTITIDGIDISDVPREQLRQSITTIPQDHVDIPGTVRDNLLPLEIINDDEDKKKDDAILSEVLKTVGLWDHISRQGGPHVPLTNIGLSAGQRQLLSLARALMHHTKRRSKIVIMDEATSNMDYQTDLIMHRVMETKFASCTRIVVTHRNTVLSQCDLLIKLEDGKAVSRERQSRVNNA
jgi:ATP-binding cassette subfamily C (CFTR/MRP) protein 1